MDTGRRATSSGRHGRPRGLTRRVFWDLAIYMVSLGLLVGAVFPSFVVLLGVDRAQAHRPLFIGACLFAGAMVGALNHGLSRVVVGRRLALLSARLRHVADTITRAGLSGEWSRSTAESSRIRIDSDDELGETARAFNSLLDALAAGQRSRSLVHNSSDVITVVDAGSVVRYQTPSIAWVLDLDPEPLLGKPVWGLTHPDDEATFRRYLTLVASGPDVRPPVALRMRHGRGGWCAVETAANNLLADPAVRGIVLTTRDVSERRLLEDRLRHQAFHDSLTGLPNRALFLDRVHAAEAASLVNGEAVSVLFLDLDNLKVVNDSAGHEGGDRLLTTVADRLAGAAAVGDTVARLGGDEFAVLLVSPTTAPDAAGVAARLLATLAEPVEIGGHSLRPSVSIGVATSGRLGGAEDLVQAADAAMYSAKQAGKNRIEVFQPRHHAAEMARRQLRADLEQAVDGDQLVMHYQPIVDLVTGGIRSFEALLRWEHPTLGLLAPVDFVGLAEESDLILSIGRWVLHEACQQASGWQRSGSRGAGVRISVNISARQFQDSSLVVEVKNALAAAQLDPRLLTLELTETLLLRDTDVTMNRIGGLKDLGVTLALDDFGIGYSSLSYLRRFPIDILKMDKSFLDDIPGNNADEAVVRAIVDIGVTLGLQLVAEGIETGEQAAALAELGCPFGQGFWFARPLPPAEALGLVALPALPAPRVTGHPVRPASERAVGRRRYGA